MEEGFPHVGQGQVFLFPVGFSAPLLWLQNCLVQAANDREEDGEWVNDGFSGTGALEAAGLGGRTRSFFTSLPYDCGPLLGCSQAVPLVPLTEENEEAMENEQFQQLLHKLGVRPPASEQVNAPVTVAAKLCWCYFKIYLLPPKNTKN